MGGTWASSERAIVHRHLPSDLRVWLNDERRRNGIEKYPASWVLAGWWQIKNLAKFKNLCAEDQGKVLFGLLRKGSPNDSLLDKAKKVLRGKTGGQDADLRSIFKAAGAKM